ncbi:GEgh16 protein [Hyaloscypha sp. PMI_1271]|nr:GEgh16 protein [Hyaloscypha sp. PMI_1271]
MPSLKQILYAASAILAVANCQGVLLSAQGTKGTPASPGLQVDPTKTDANIINEAEINANVVNECGRTLLAGNIDIGQNTEDQLANKTVTSVTKGSTVAVTIRQGSADGAGPYTCDMDLTSNADGVSGQTNLTVKETDSADGKITLAVKMPSDMACIGASTGNVCTVRCFNSAAAGPFGGCFAVQQTDVTPNANSPATIKTEQTLEGVAAQIAVNQVDLPAAVKANQDASTEAEQGLLEANALLAINNLGQATGVAAVAATTATTSAKSTATAKAKAGKKGQKGVRAFVA